MFIVIVPPRESNTRLLDVDVDQLHEVEAFLRSRMLPLKYIPNFYVI